MHSFKKTLMASAIVAALPLAAPMGFAQDQTTLEEVVVTGTRKVGLSPSEILSPIDY